MDYQTSIDNLLEGLLDDKNAKPTDLPITLLKAITRDFSDHLLIGSGGFAQVYKGLLRNGGTVAVKKLANSIVIDEKTYNQEVACLMRAKHKNVVRFLGYCADTQGKICHHSGKFVMADVQQRLLCFEYLPKGSLDQYISSKIMGYLAPEFFRGIVTRQLDIYSLGVIILEILIGQKGHTPVECVLESWKNTSNESLDKSMLEQVKVCAEIGTRCIDLDPAKRPVIQSIIEMLKETETATDDFIENSMSTALTKQQGEETLPALHGGTTKVASNKRYDASVPKVKLGAIPRLNSVPRGKSCTDFGVLVQVMAPRECTEISRIDVDLVAVLSLPKSFRLFHAKDCIKQAIMFVIDHLGPADRLSIVTFNEDQVRCRMPLSILRQREADDRSNRVGRIIVLCYDIDYKIVKENISNEFLVETFHLDESHYATNMQFIGQTTSGIHSYVIEDIERIKDAMAVCIGGLTSVNAMAVKIHLETFEGVTISSIDSAAYHATIDPDDSQTATIHVDDLYAGEHKNFIVRLSIHEGSSERLMAVSGCYRNPKISMEDTIELDCSVVYVLRPTVTAPLMDQAVCPEVAGEVIRFRLLKEVSEMMEGQTELKELKNIWQAIRGSEDGQAAPESTKLSLARDVDEMQRGLYSKGNKLEGTAFALSWITSNRLQRATSKISPSVLLTSFLSRSHDFRTNAMEDMLHDVDREMYADILQGRHLGMVKYR
ncbi:hypothetical protein EJB05_57751, partial [Eragrostis curvula]